MFAALVTSHAPTLFRTYDEAIEFIFGRINYERVAGLAYSADDGKLERMRRLLDLLGHPEERLPVVHIAGTKGKGSTSVMTAGILSAAGYRTGLFTSPHVSVFEERMVVNGQRPTPEHLVDLINRLLEPVETMDAAAAGGGPTYFELATALAWLYFLDQRAEVAVLEVGLGGRLDATNVCRDGYRTWFGYGALLVIARTFRPPIPSFSPQTLESFPSDWNRCKPFSVPTHKAPDWSR